MRPIAHPTYTDRMRTLRLSDGRLPITRGTMADFAHAPLDCLRRLQAEHGDVAAIEDDDGRRVHFVFSPDLNRQVLTDSKRFHSKFFAMRGGKKSAQRKVSSGLLSMNGAAHKTDRRIVMEPFALKSLDRYHDDVIAVSDALLADWQPGATRDINADMTAYMLRLTCTILFGLDTPELAYKIGRLTEEWVALNHELGLAAYVPDLGLTARYDELMESAVELEGALEEMIAEKRANGFGRDVLSLLIQAKDAGHLDNTRLLGHMTLLFGAAHLTSAHTLTWTLLLLAQHPDIRRSVDAEIDEVIGKDEVRPEHLSQLTVLDRVIKESMRVLPASCYLGRFAAEPVELGPFSLAPGAPVVFSQFTSHHRAEAFAQPDRFDPSRWESAKPSPYEYLPFGGGSRRCIGASLGMMQFLISLPRMLRGRSFQLQAGAEVNYKAHSTMLHPDSPVMMTLGDAGEHRAVPFGGSIHDLTDFGPASRLKKKTA